MKLLIRNGIIVTDLLEERMDLLIENEKIIRMEKNIQDQVNQIIDATGQYVFPGIIDAHVHFHMPIHDGYTADDFRSGSIAALHGGVTTVIDFASEVDNSFIKGFAKRNQDAEIALVDYTYHMEVNAATTITEDLFVELAQLGIKSIKIYTTYGSDKIAYENVKTLFTFARQYDCLIMAHAEDDNLLKQKREELLTAGFDSIKYHGISRPIDAEVKAIKDLIKIAKDVGNKLYIAHVSSKLGLEEIDKAQEEGFEIYGETCPHYFAIDDSVYNGKQAGEFVMSPPLRPVENGVALKEGLANQVITVLSTDHCAFLKEQKQEKVFTKAMSGIPGVEYLLPLSFSELCSSGYLPIKNLISALAVTPAKLFGIFPQKGTLSIQSDADIVIYNPVGKTIIQGGGMSKAGYSPFEGKEITGSITYTIRRGEIMVSHGKLVKESLGKFIRDEESQK